MNEQLMLIGGIIGRQALTAAGTYAVAKGWIDATTATDLVTQISGAAAITAAAAWSYNQKKRAKK